MGGAPGVSGVCGGGGVSLSPVPFASGSSGTTVVHVSPCD